MLARHGYLREAGVLASVVCDECDVPHSAPVVYEMDGYGYFCPDLGFQTLDIAKFAAFLPDIPKLVDRIAGALDCRRRKSSSIYGETWRVGAAQTDVATVMLYFHPTLETEDDVRALHDALGREARSEWRLVVTAQGALPIADLATVRLDEFVEIDITTGELRVFADPGFIAGVPRKNPGGAPNRYGEMLTQLIKERIANGKAVNGRNKEASAVLSDFILRNPHTKPPSLSSVQNYVTNVRAEQ